MPNRNEPPGAADFAEPLTAFEHAVSALEKGYRLRLQRVETYDRQHGFFYSVVDCVPEPAKAEMGGMPDPEDIADRLTAFVKGEATGTSAPAKPYVAPKLQMTPEARLSTSFVEEFALLSEANTAFSQELDDIASKPGRGLVEQVFSILRSSLLGDRKNAQTLTLDYLEQQLDPIIEDRLPIQFVLPAFPFKDQNPFRTCTEPAQPDMGEIALLLHLHSIALSISQIYSYGCSWVVLSDGTLYSHMFGIGPDEAKRYLTCLRSWRNRLNLQQTIHLLDLEECCTTVGLTPEPTSEIGLPFAEAQQVAQVVHEASAADARVAVHIELLARGMAWNLNTQDLVATSGKPRLWDALQSLRADFPSARAASRGSLRRRLADLAFDTAVAYASTNLVLQMSNAVGLSFPQALRATVHPKPGQVAVPRSGAVYPWNGVALLDDRASPPRSISAVELHELQQRTDIAVLTLPDLDSPFLFVPISR